MAGFCLKFAALVLGMGGLSMDKPMRTLVALGMVAALALPLLVPHGYWLGPAWLAGLGAAALLVVLGIRAKPR